VIINTNPVRRAQHQAKKVGGIVSCPGTGASHNGNRIRAVFLLYTGKSSGYFIQSIVPGYPLPTASSPLPGTLHGVFQAVGVIEKLGLSLSFNTNESPVHGVPGVSFYLGYLTVLYVNQYAAITMTSLTNTPYNALHIHLSIPYFTLTSVSEQGRVSGHSLILTCNYNFGILATSLTSPNRIYRGHMFEDLRNILEILEGY
jgi:hypothetical protein